MAVTNFSAARNTYAAEQKKAIAQSSAPWIRTLLTESGSLAETNSDATHQCPSECSRPFPRALPRERLSGYSRKLGVERSNHDDEYAKLQLTRGLFCCYRR